MKHKNSQLFFLSAALILMSSLLFAQNNKPVIHGPTNSYYAITPDGNQNNVILTNQQPNTKVISPEKTELLQQLETARHNNNVQLAEDLQAKLHKMDGIAPSMPSNSMAHGGPVAEQEGVLGDFMTSQVNNLSVFSHAVATVPTGYPNAGRIFMVSSQFSSSADTLKYYYSDNGGQTWTYFYNVYFNLNWDYLNDDIDIEVVNDGTNIWLWTSAGYHDYSDGRNKALWVRFNTNTGGNLYAVQFFYPGSGSVGNNYYNVRVTSDNSNYTGATYVYFVSSFDSLYSGSSHYIRQKYAVCENPFAATPVMMMEQPTNGGFYWNASSLGAGIRLFSDIGYYKDVGGTGSNRIMTVYSDADAGFNNMYLAWSDNFGTTIAGNMVLTEGNKSYGARIAFNGGPTYRTGMITYTRQFSGTDWDCFYQNTSTGGSTAGSWTANYIDASTNRCRSTDIMAIRGGNNLFKSAYGQDNPTIPAVFSSDFNGTTWSASPIVVSTVLPDTIYAKPRAGYTTTADNCLTIWAGGPSGINTYASRLCNTTVGISNNEIPRTYSLSQNYPNPFNPTTSIQFGIPKAGFVKLVVYDITGKQVTEIVNGNMEAGNHQINFDASNLATGVYLYKIEADGFTDVKKMMLIK